LNESDRVGQADQISARMPSSSSTHLSNTMRDSQTIPASPLTQVLYKEPEIVIQPKKDWHPRYPKDLIPKQKTKIMGLLQGVGGQRTRIKVKVSCLLY
jgi:hypothetical protein